MGKVINFDNLWTEVHTFQLINYYKENYFLWDRRVTEYRQQEKKTKYLKELAAALNISVRQVRNKWKKLTIYYYREQLKSKGTDYVSKWFAFKAMSFLDFNRIDLTAHRKQIDTERSEINITSENEPTTSDLNQLKDANLQEDQYKELNAELVPSFQGQPEEANIKDTVEDRTVLLSHNIDTNYLGQFKDSNEDKNLHKQDTKTSFQSKDLNTVHGQQFNNIVHEDLKLLLKQDTSIDEDLMFAEYVTAKLENVDPKTKAELIVKINDILDQAEMGLLPVRKKT